MSPDRKRIKICGLTREQDILAINQWKPDFAGFVFAKGKRTVTREEAGRLKEKLSPEIQAAGVFVNSPVDDIIFLTERRIIDLVQLHGDEDAGYIEGLKSRLSPSVPLIKAVRVRQARDIVKAQALPVEFLLFDSYAKDAYGGTGTAFSWDMIPSVKKPWFLAGGIGKDNIREALKTEAFCLDLSSSLETDGKKDPEKIKEIMEIIRSETQWKKEDSDSTEGSLCRKR